MRSSAEFLTDPRTGPFLTIVCLTTNCTSNLLYRLVAGQATSSEMLGVKTTLVGKSIDALTKLCCQWGEADVIQDDGEEAKPNPWLVLAVFNPGYKHNVAILRDARRVSLS